MSTSFPLIETDPPALDEKKLGKELEAKSLREVMDFKRHQDEEAKRKQEILDQVRRENLSVLGPYLEETKGILLSEESGREIDRIVKELGLDRNKVAILPLKPSKELSLETVLANKQRFLDELFGPGKIQCVVVKDENGNNCIASIGATAAEINATKNIYFEKKAAEQKAAMAAEIIQQKIKQHTPSLPSSERTDPLATPALAASKAAISGPS